MQYSTVQYSTVQYSTVQYSTVQYSTVQYSTVQYSTVQYSTVQYSTVQYSTAQHSTVQYSLHASNTLLDIGRNSLTVCCSLQASRTDAGELHYHRQLSGDTLHDTLRVILFMTCCAVNNKCRREDKSALFHNGDWLTVLPISQWVQAAFDSLGSNGGGKVVEDVVHLLHGVHLQHEAGNLAPPHLHHTCCSHSQFVLGSYYG